MNQAPQAITGEIFSRHDMQNHAECDLRLQYAIAGIPGGTPVIAPRPADRADLKRVHLSRYIEEVESLSAALDGQDDITYLDPSTYLTADSFLVASYAAGSAIGAAEAALAQVDTFAICRPPGHHALPGRGMGYCIFNNAAIAAAWALERVSRVAILDWDLHHGNGTQEIFLRSDRVLYCSLHHREAFPGTGWADDVGEGPGRGYTLNAPLAAGCTVSDYLAVLSRVVSPVIEDFGPGLLVISCGLDALEDDPHGVMALCPRDYAALVTAVRNLSPPALALVLEGGYGPSIGHAVKEIFYALSRSREDPYRTERDLEGNGPVRSSTRDLIRLLCRLHR